MAGNLSLVISANTAEARAQLALVNNDVKTLGSSLRKLASDAAASDINSTVGAQLRQVATQFEAAKAQAANLNAELKGTVEGGFREFGAAIREPLEGLAMMSSRMRETAELAGLMFAIDKMREWISSMGELGERTVNMAAAVGTTPHEFSLLSRALQLAGGDADTAGRTLERLGKNLQEALTTPTSAAAKAANSLAISHAELRRASTDLSYALELLFNKFAEFADSPAKTADFLALMGRGMDQLVPAMHRGAAGFEEFKQKAQETGTVLSNEEAQALAETGEKVHLLAETLEGEGVRGFLAIKDSINSAIDGLTGFIKATGDAMANFRNFMGQVVSGEDLAAAVGAQSGVMMLPPVGVTASRSGAAAGAGAAADQDFSGADTKPSVGQWPTKAKKTKGQATEVETWREQLQQQLEAEHNFFADSKAEELAFWQQKVALTKAGSKERAQVETTIYGLEKSLAQQNERDQEAAISSKEAIGNALIAAKQAQITDEHALGKTSATQELASEQALLTAKWELDQQYFAEKLAAAENDLHERTKLLDQEKLAYIKFVTDQNKLTQQSALATKTWWTNAFAPIKGAIISGVEGVAKGTTTPAQAAGGVANAALNEVISAAFDKGFALLSNLFTSVLPQALQSFLGIGAQTLSTSAIVTAITLTGPSATALAMGPVLALANAPILAALVALNAKPSVLGTTYAKGGVVPFASGGWVVSSPTIFPMAGGMGLMGESGPEGILPLTRSPGGNLGVEASGVGGGHTFNFNIAANDGASVAKFFRANAPALIAAIHHGVRFGSPITQS